MEEFLKNINRIIIDDRIGDCMAYDQILPFGCVCPDDSGRNIKIKITKTEDNYWEITSCYIYGYSRRRNLTRGRKIVGGYKPIIEFILSRGDETKVSVSIKSNGSANKSTFRKALIQFIMTRSNNQTNEMVDIVSSLI